MEMNLFEKTPLIAYEGKLRPVENAPENATFMQKYLHKTQYINPMTNQPDTAEFFLLDCTEYGVHILEQKDVKNTTPLGIESLWGRAIKKAAESGEEENGVIDLATGKMLGTFKGCYTYLYLDEAHNTYKIKWKEGQVERSNEANREGVFLIGGQDEIKAQTALYERVKRDLKLGAKSKRYEIITQPVNPQQAQNDAVNNATPPNTI